MGEEQMRRTFTEAPTFARIGDDALLSALLELEITCDNDHLPMTDHFEFSCTSVEFDHPGDSTKATDRKILTNGLVFPAYPIFNQSIVIDNFEPLSEQELMESLDRMSPAFKKNDLHSGSVSSSSSTSLEVDDHATYSRTQRSTSQSSNPWFMSQSMVAKSSEFRRFRIRDLFVSRSQRDEKVKLVDFPTPKEKGGGFSTIPCFKPMAMTEAGKKAKKVKEKGRGKGLGKAGEDKDMDLVTAHRIFYGKGITVRRRGFQPYQLGLIGGFFCHGKH